MPGWALRVAGDADNWQAVAELLEAVGDLLATPAYGTTTSALDTPIGSLAEFHLPSNLAAAEVAVAAASEHGDQDQAVAAGGLRIDP
jgi:hypothetical protein